MIKPTNEITVDMIDVSPLTKSRVVKHKIDMEEKKDEHTWEACCLVADKRAITFFSQFFITMGVMSFCIVQLVRLDDCNSEQAYLGLLTLLIGISLPNPKFQHNTE